MIRVRMAAAAVVLAAAMAPAGAQAPAGGATAPAANAAALSPAVQAALKDLSAEDYKTRQAALSKLELALGRQMSALVASDDPEVQSRTAELLEFNDGLSRWALEALKLPAEQRQAQLDFGLQPEVLPVLANVFSADVEKRVRGVKDLAKLSSPEATAMLARLLDDPERAVYLAAIEAVWDRKPSDAVVDSLWNRAVESGFAGLRQQSGDFRNVPVPQKVMFRGRALNDDAYRGGVFLGQDAGIAGDALIHLQAPQVHQKLKRFMPELEQMAEKNSWVMMNLTEQMKNVYRLEESYKSKEGIGVFYRIATAPMRQSSAMQMGAEKYFWSNRTQALAGAVLATGQKPEDYKLRQSAQVGEIWTAPTQDDEDAAIKKLQEWMAANGEKYDLKGAAEPATQGAHDGAGAQPGPANAAPAKHQRQMHNP